MSPSGRDITHTGRLFQCESADYNRPYGRLGAADANWTSSARSCIDPRAAANRIEPLPPHDPNIRAPLASPTCRTKPTNNSKSEMCSVGDRIRWGVGPREEPSQGARWLERLPFVHRLSEPVGDGEDHRRVVAVAEVAAENGDVLGA
jgi:hypothetical protein